MRAGSITSVRIPYRDPAKTRRKGPYGRAENQFARFFRSIVTVTLLVTLTLLLNPPSPAFGWRFSSADRGR